MSGKKRNAFDCLLGRSTSKQKKNRFVACPSCGSNVFDDLLNSHLDTCVQHPDPDTNASPTHPIDSNSTAVQSAGTAVAEGSDGTSNVFAHMMKQSKRLHQTSSQNFHLNNDYSLSWRNTDKESRDTTAWSTTIQLRQNETKIQLTLSSSIPEQSSPLRLVQRHSRLSVPVLKSILQKSVRRRRPLPATRVAMEIVDKALGELLRRMPIIVLEDSTLHPDLPLLCWLMAAESKGYKIPMELISKVLQIIYEVSSCPWTDYLDDNDEKDDIVGDELPPDSPEMLILRSLDMRASYGGMKCDMQMLKRYQMTWGQRYRDSTRLSPETSKRLGGGQQLNGCLWRNVPGLIHAKARHAGLQHVISLTRNHLVRLESKDLCVEGVDFHCSDVLGQLMGDKAFVLTCRERLQRDALLQKGETGANAQLLAILKSCMWKYSSGINFRQPLLNAGDNKATVALTKNDDDAALKAFWQEMVTERAKAFMTQYVKSRLVNN